MSHTLKEKKGNLLYDKRAYTLKNNVFEHQTFVLGMVMYDDRFAKKENNTKTKDTCNF